MSEVGEAGRPSGWVGWRSEARAGETVDYFLCVCVCVWGGGGGGGVGGGGGGGRERNWRRVLTAVAFALKTF